MKKHQNLCLSCQIIAAFSRLKAATFLFHSEPRGLYTRGRLQARAVSSQSLDRVGTDAELHTTILAAAVELGDCVHGRGKVKVRAVPRLQSHSVVSLGAVEDKRRWREIVGVGSRKL